MPALPSDDVTACPSDYFMTSFLAHTATIMRPELMSTGTLYGSLFTFASSKPMLQVCHPINLFSYPRTILVSGSISAVLKEVTDTMMANNFHQCHLPSHPLF